MRSLNFLVFISFLNFGCAQHYDSNYVPPENTLDGIPTGTLQDVQMDANKVMKGVTRIEQGKFREVHSMLIYKDEKLVVEEYFKGHKYRWDASRHHDSLVEWNRDLQHKVHSVTKSITSLCIGIAIDRGFIESVHQSIFDYLPNYQHLRTPQKESITIEHLLTMTSGLQWAEWNAPLSSMENDQIAIWFYKDGPINFALGRPLVAVPGTRFNYSGGDMQILGEILKNATNMNLAEFSGKYLFEPLAIETFRWWLIFPSGEIHAAGGLEMRPKDMVKIGAMMLNRGNWKGKQVISEDWVNKCIVPWGANQEIKIPGEDLGRMGYSYTWWTKEINFNGKTIHWFSANGWGGQRIIILPELDMVIAFTGGCYTHKVKEFEIFERYILPAIQPKEASQF